MTALATTVLADSLGWHHGDVGIGWWIVMMLGMVIFWGAIFMNVNFHLANGSPHPWLIPRDGFDEGVDMDSLLPLIQVVFLSVSAKLLVTLRRTEGSGSRPRRDLPALNRAGQALPAQDVGVACQQRQALRRGP